MACMAPASLASIAACAKLGACARGQPNALAAATVATDVGALPPTYTAGTVGKVITADPVTANADADAAGVCVTGAGHRHPPPASKGPDG
jgi:hypothetical protein